MTGEESSASLSLSTDYSLLDILIEVVIVLLGVFFGLLADSYVRDYLQEDRRSETLQILGEGLLSSSMATRKKMDQHQRMLEDFRQAAEAYSDASAWRDSLGTIVYSSIRIPSSFLEVVRQSDTFGELGGGVRVRLIQLENRIENIRRIERRVMGLLYELDYSVWLSPPGKRAPKGRRLDTMDALMQVQTPLHHIIKLERHLFQDLNELAELMEKEGIIFIEGLPQELPDEHLK